MENKKKDQAFVLIPGFEEVHELVQHGDTLSRASGYLGGVQEDGSSSFC